MINSVVLVGRLVRDPELRFTNSQKAFCSFTLAVDRQYKEADGSRQADFIDCVVWDKTAELCANYLTKGKLAGVDGRLQIRSYTDKDGNSRKATSVVAEKVAFLSPKNEQQAAPVPDVYAPMGSDDDLPF